MSCDDHFAGCLLGLAVGDALGTTPEFRQPGSFKPITDMVREDADTVGAVYGQLAGAFYGASGIPGEWLERLADRDLIQNLIDKLQSKRCSG